MTYNHENYIQDALDSFLEQKVNFKYEIIVHDDASTDETADIVKSYEQKYPNLIKGIYQVKNQYDRMIWLLFSFIQNVCKGKYVAICEGDDYWIDYHKLQIQVDYLESHPECVLTIHDAIKINYKDKTIKAMTPFKDEGYLLPKDVIIQDQEITPTASMVLRRSAADMDLNGLFVKLGIIGDYPLMLYLQEKGKIFYFDRIMSAYRYMHLNSWSVVHYSSDKLKNFKHIMELIEFMMNYNVYTNAKYEKYVISKIHCCFEHLLYSVFEFRKKKKGIDYFLKICKEYDMKTDYKYHKYCQYIERTFLLLSQQKIKDHKMLKYVNKKNNILIYGTGNYCELIERQLDFCNIKYDGFVVSDNQKICNSSKQKPIWKISSLPFDKEKLGIIISVNPRIWDEIVSSLEAENIQDYICPFLLKDRRIHTDKK